MFTQSTYFIKQEFAFFKLTSKYFIIDPENNKTVAVATENISALQKYSRLLIKKQFFGTTVEIKEESSGKVMYAIKKSGMWAPKVTVADATGNSLGYFKTKVLSLKGKFDVYTSTDTKLAEVTGEFLSWNYSFTDTSGKQLGMVTKKWSGIGKELFTNSDNYVISIDDSLKGDSNMMALLIMAGLALDVVYREKN
jgi:uncharacterized protein YxjI